ncbi:MAG TPA: hypothetical protein VJ785_04440, partial [Anaerolineales bacterium]|nr:hypothetical protein [Anaerolineales bacterium]
FFLPFDGSIFAFNVNNQAGWSSYLLWGGVILLIIRGLMISIKTISSNVHLLLLAGFAGIILSIPFLPPIDGGSRFYASTAPFFFIMPVAGLAGLLKTSKQDAARETIQPDMSIMRIGSIVLSLLTVVTPLMILNWNSGSQLSVPSCSPDEKPFVTRFPSGSYVDLVSEPRECGLAPEICLNDFERNGVEKKVDDFFQKLYSLAEESNGVRVQPAVNFMDGKLKYFLISEETIRDGLPPGNVSGCAIGIETLNQSIYQVESIIPNEE